MLTAPKSGLPDRVWTKVRRKMLETGIVDVNLLEDMSPEQKYWVNETKKALRDFMGDAHPDTHDNNNQ